MVSESNHPGCVVAGSGNPHNQLINIDLQKSNAIRTDGTPFAIFSPVGNK